MFGNWTSSTAPLWNSSRRPQAFVRKKFENIVSFVLIHIFIELENYSVYTSVQFVPKDKQSRVTRMESALWSMDCFIDRKRTRNYLTNSHGHGIGFPINATYLIYAVRHLQIFVGVLLKKKRLIKSQPASKTETTAHKIELVQRKKNY